MAIQDFESSSLVDILMITHNRPAYTKKTLSRLLDTCTDGARVWVWQNGNDQKTIEVVDSLKGHPKFYNFFHSEENKKLTEPTNWLWNNSDASYFSKVDDDCLLPFGWIEKLVKAHDFNSSFGIIACWHFWEEDFVPSIAKKKIEEFSGGHHIMKNCWVGGSGYLMKRSCYDKYGPLRINESFTDYGIKLALNGYINGWYFPFIYQEHLDDPRSHHSLLKTDDDMNLYAPLSAINRGVTTIEGWKAQLHRSAINLQSAPYKPKSYIGWRNRLRGIKTAIASTICSKRRWC